MELKPTHKYDDIIDLPHHVSTKRLGMSAVDRAAQFSPFAALTGYEEVIRQTGRITDQRTELSDGAVQKLNEKLCMLAAYESYSPWVQLTYFVPDRIKEGGSYQTLTGRIKRIDAYGQKLVLTDGQEIPFVAIRQLLCDSLPEL